MAQIVENGIGYTYWASYLINGDDSGISDEDKRHADQFAEWLGGSIVSAGEDSFFRQAGLSRGLLDWRLLRIHGIGDNMIDLSQEAQEKRARDDKKAKRSRRWLSIGIAIFFALIIYIAGYSKARLDSPELQNRLQKIVTESKPFGNDLPLSTNQHKRKG